jgi:hypothetical protein
MTDITLSLVSHTNVGKTTLARTLLGRDIGEVRDAAHVTEQAERHLLIECADEAGGPPHRMWLWDTPGFGDSVRLVQRMRQSGTPIGWLLGQLWDRWRDRGFWASQQLVRHIQADSEVLLYLVNASEPDAAWLAPELDLLEWMGRPVLVLLNQLGPPRDAAAEHAEQQAWQERLARWPQVRAVLALDAFARCWVHERVLLDQVAALLAGERVQAMRQLNAAWAARQQQVFAQAMQALGASLARTVHQRVPLPAAPELGARLRALGARITGQPVQAEDAAATELAAALQDEVRSSTAALLALHGVPGEAGAGLDAVLQRVARQTEAHRPLPEGRAALIGGALSGALAGLKADIATGGLTLGGGLLAGGILGALGGAGVARGVNLVRGTREGFVGWSEAALPGLVQAALLRYLAVAHYGRGRGDWAESEAPAHWPAAVQAALDADGTRWQALWREHETLPAQALESRLVDLLQGAARRTLTALYPPAE